MNKHFFLTRDQQFVECELISESAYKRTVKFLEGEQKDKVINVHPKGVSWGSMFPRLFESSVKPDEVFVFKGRALLKKHTLQEDQVLVPHVNPDYRFQPFVSSIVDSINVGENVLLTGGTGVGKTSSILQIASRINQPVLRINFNGETRMSDLIGKNQVIAGETKWADGVLPMAMRNGYWLVLDELDFADPAVLSLLHPVLEENPMLVLKENSGEVIIPHKDFRLFATANSIGAMQDRAGSYSGTNQMNEAFLDRWQVLMVNPLSEKEELKVVRSQAPGIKSRWAKRIVQFAHAARNKSLDDSFEFGSDNFSTRKVIAWAKKTALLRNPIKAARLAWLDKMPESEQEVIIKILETQFGGTAKKLKKPKASKGEFGAKRGPGRPKKMTL